jgi:hypothetical protein
VKQCKYCGDSWVLEGRDICYTCILLKMLIDRNVARARNVYDRNLLEVALCDYRQRYVAILKDLEATDETM